MHAAEYDFGKTVKYLPGGSGCESSGDPWPEIGHNLPQLEVCAAECISPLAYSMGLVYHHMEYAALFHLIQHSGRKQYLRVCYDYLHFSVFYLFKGFGFLFLCKTTP